MTNDALTNLNLLRCSNFTYYLYTHVDLCDQQHQWTPIQLSLQYFHFYNQDIITYFIAWKFHGFAVELKIHNLESLQSYFCFIYSLDHEIKMPRNPYVCSNRAKLKCREIRNFAWTALLNSTKKFFRKKLN